MKPSPWLAELYRQWHAARGGRVSEASRAFIRPWEKLLDAAGLHAADERAVAAREAEDMERQGRLELRRHRYRCYLIEKVALPVASEPWLAALFFSATGGAARDASLDVVRRWQRVAHPYWPESWRSLCEGIESAFAEARALRPFRWRAPEEVERVLALLHAVTSCEWPQGTLVRDASCHLGLDSKALERHRRVLEVALARLFGKPTPLEALGLVCSQSKVVLQGALTLHFADGSEHHTASLHGETSLALPDLLRATHATTSAARLLTIENAKETFQQAIARNRTGDTLMVTTSYPNRATLRLLELLPAGLPHFHFGDTDASGYAILRALRERSSRTVQPFLMSWRDAPESPVLSEHDRRILPSMLSNDLLKDCHADLASMSAAGRKGRFEQEALGPPVLDEWPYWRNPTTVESPMR